MCVCVVSGRERGWGCAESDYICLFTGTVSHGWVPWFLSERVSVCNPDFSELLRYLSMHKNGRMTAWLFLFFFFLKKMIFTKNGSKMSPKWISWPCLQNIVIRFGYKWYGIKINNWSNLFKPFTFPQNFGVSLD